MKYTIIKLNEDQTNQNKIEIHIDSLKRLLDTNKNVVLVNQREEQSLLTIEYLATKGEEVTKEKTGELFYLFDFVENGCPLDKVDLKWITRLHYSWYNRLGDYLKSDDFLDKLAGANARRNEVKVFPSKEDIFKAYQLPYNRIRLIILGQDPYPQAKNKASGLAFASEATEKPYALAQIEKAVRKQLNYPSGMSMTGDLEYLVKQGVMLLNTSLSVEEGKPGSHTETYIDLMIETIKQLDASNVPIVFVLMGKQAQTYAQYINPLIHTIFKVEHPSAGAYNDNKEWDSKNLFVELAKLISIKWM